MATTMTPATEIRIDATNTGPSFGAALCGFLCTTVATTMVMFLLSSL